MLRRSDDDDDTGVDKVPHGPFEPNRCHEPEVQRFTSTSVLRMYITINHVALPCPTIPHPQDGFSTHIDYLTMLGYILVITQTHCDTSIRSWDFIILVKRLWSYAMHPGGDKVPSIKIGTFNWYFTGVLKTSALDYHTEQLVVPERKCKSE